MTEHPGYKKHSADGNGSGNSRNVKINQILKGDHGEVETGFPRDRDGLLRPASSRKVKTLLSKLDDQIRARCIGGMSTCDIVATLKTPHDADVSPAVLFTDRVLEQVQL